MADRTDPYESCAARAIPVLLTAGTGEGSLDSSFRTGDSSPSIGLVRGRLTVRRVSAPSLLSGEIAGALCIDLVSVTNSRQFSVLSLLVTLSPLSSSIPETRREKALFPLWSCVMATAAMMARRSSWFSLGRQFLVSFATTDDDASSAAKYDEEEHDRIAVGVSGRTDNREESNAVCWCFLFRRSIFFFFMAILLMGLSNLSSSSSDSSSGETGAFSMPAATVAAEMLGALGGGGGVVARPL
mmetsp:Transcript_20142/g.43837  ORF Transcript_20142/g.43837 Transcript_20142/m.43837 type:complete len:242 (-) Transcript_20142:1068-1793(-)